MTITETSAVTGLTISQATHTITIADDEATCDVHSGSWHICQMMTDGFTDHSTSSPPANGPESVGPFGVSPNQWSLSYTDAPGTDSSGQRL